MEENKMPAEDSNNSKEEEVQIDPHKADEFQQKLELEQNLPMAVIAGAAAAIIGGAIWAVVTVTTNFQIGWMAVGVGFLVGYGVRYFGKGVTNTYGIIGASFALAGCLIGNLFTVCGFAAAGQSVPYMQVLTAVLHNPFMAVEMMKASFSPFDLLFYGIAVYEGYKLSFRQLSERDFQEIIKD